MSRLFSLIRSLRFVFHVLIFYTSPLRTSVLEYERDRWLELNHFPKRGLSGFLLLLNVFPEYRSLFYHRTGAKWLSFFAKGQTNLYFHTPQENIGRGLVLWHAYSTVINAQSVGNDCQIWHLVTLGKKDISQKENRPVIGSNVSICTGSVVIGDIHIGDNSLIGANSVANKSVPENCVAVGTPIQIINK